MFTNAVGKTMKLRKVRRHVKNYRPSYLVMCGDPKERPHLVYLGTVLRQSADTMVIYAQVKVRTSLRLSTPSFSGSQTSLITANSSNLLITDFDNCQRCPHDKGYLPYD